MNFFDLSCFVTAAEEMNFTRAAKRLYITQQSLSSRIAKLEQYYKVKLFNRGSPLTLTKEGNILLSHAKRILYEEEMLRREFESIKDNSDSELNIGISRYRSNIMMPLILPKFYDRFPNICVRLTEAPLAKLNKSLEQGEVNMIMGYIRNDESSIKSALLYKEDILFVIPDNIFKLCLTQQEKAELLNRERISFRYAQKMPLIRMGKGTWLRELLDNFAEENNTTFSSYVETTSIDTMISLCIQGMGAMVCPEIYLNFRELKQKGMHIFKISEEMFTQSICINYSDARPMSQASIGFIEMAKDIFHQGWFDTKKYS